MGTNQTLAAKNLAAQKEQAAKKAAQQAAQPAPVQTTVPAPAPAQPSEDTIAGYLRDVARNVKKATKAANALAELGDDDAIKPAKDALKARKEQLAKAAGQRVYDYIMSLD